MNKGTNYNFLSQNLEEVQAVFSLIHQNHKEWQINPEQVFLLGCSAGGHLAAWYGNSEQIHRPKGVILCYPVTSFTFGWPSDLSHFNFEIENIQPLFGIRLMMRVFLSITALNIVIDSQNIKFLLKLTFLNLDLMVSLWLIGQPLLLMPIVFRQCIAGFLGLLIGWKDKSKIKNTTQKWYFFIGFI